MTQDNALKARLSNLDLQVDTAIVSRDSAALRAMFADDCVYTHSSGRSEPAHAFMVDLEAGVYKSLSRKPYDIEVEIHDDVAFTRGRIDIVFPDSSKKTFRYVRAYRRQEDMLRLISSLTIPLG